MRWKGKISRRRRKAGHESIGTSAAGDRPGADVLTTQGPAQAQAQVQVQVRVTSDESLVRLRQESYGAEAAQTDEMSPARPKTEGICNGEGKEKDKGKGKGKDPELVIKGDRLTNTPQMILLVYVCIALQVSYLLQVGCVVGVLAGKRAI